MPDRLKRLAWLVLSFSFWAAPASAEKPRYAGAGEGAFLLPNGWRLSPAGEQVELDDLPLNIIAVDATRALVATSGYNRHELVLVNVKTRQRISTETVAQSWYGLAADPPSGRVWWSGGGGNQIHSYQLAGELHRTGGPDTTGKAPAANKPPAGAKPATGSPTPPPRFLTGMVFDAQRKRLYSCSLPAQLKNKSLAWGDADRTDPDAPRIEAGALAMIDEQGRTVRVAPAGIRPYDVVIARNGKLYISDWADQSVLVFDPVAWRVIGKIRVGEHPNQIAVHPRDARLFVACASTNEVAVIDTSRGLVTESISTALFPLAPEGSTPDAVAISPDGQTLYVANADNNCVAVIDVSSPGRSQVKGFIPTGWYPTALAVTPDGGSLLIGVGWGNQSHPNAPLADEPDGKNAKAATKRVPFTYIGKTLAGSLSIVTIPNEEQLAAFTETVYRNCPYSDKLLTAASHPEKTAIPTRVGDASPIKHVIYIIKENRTYDQVFGDMPEGNGDPSLVMFGEKVTPNHHKLAREYVLLDNLYCNGHVSADGHPWSTMAYNTDYIARNWALTYSRRAGVEDDEDGDLSNAPSGYMWDACARNGLSYRSYGEFGGRVSQPDGSLRMEGRVPGLVGHMSPEYGLRKAGTSVRDTDRVDVFLEEFRQFEARGDLPRFIVMSLGEDHTSGTTPGSFTPEACVASNDLALGRLVEAVSRSKYWPQTAIFVIEDDAQNGPDHVDAHRTVGLVISPYARRHHLDSTQYSTVSMLRTMELILGLAPLSQYDAAARPMFASFTDRAQVDPYTHEKPRIDIEARNTRLAYGADRSSRMDFSEYDKIDDFELNEILWRAVKGVDAPLPPAVRRAIAYRPKP